MARFEYVPLPPPQLPDALPMYVQNELVRLAQIIGGLSEQVFIEEFVAPSKTQNGQIVFADGTSWNPGSGRGLYQYRDGSGWVFIV